MQPNNCRLLGPEELKWRKYTLVGPLILSTRNVQWVKVEGGRVQGALDDSGECLSDNEGAAVSEDASLSPSDKVELAEIT